MNPFFSFIPDSFEDACFLVRLSSCSFWPKSILASFSEEVSQFVTQRRYPLYDK
jgi:hypothetical protein